MGKTRKERTVSKINSNKAGETLRRIILRCGVDKGLRSISAVGVYLGYDARLFRNRVNNQSFDLLELRDMFRRLQCKDEEILEVIKCW